MSELIGSNEIGLRDLFSKVKAWRQFVLSRWIKIVVMGILGGGIGFVYAWMSKPQYSASVSFVLAAGDNGKMGGLSGLAGQLGVDIAGGGGNDAFSGDNITTLMISRVMIQKALFTKPTGSNQILVNLIVEELKLNKAWAASKRTANCYPFPVDLSTLTPVQDSLFREVHNMVMTKKIIGVDKPNKKQSIFVVNSVFSNELVAAFFPKYLVNETARFYINTKTKVAQQNLNMLQHEADSLHRLLNGVIASTASSVDRTFNLNSAYQLQRADVQGGQLRITAVSSAYGEVLKNLEIAKISLQKETPLFQIIDEPILPLKKQKIGKVSCALLVGVVFSFFFVLYLTLSFVYKSYRGC